MLCNCLQPLLISIHTHTHAQNVSSASLQTSTSIQPMFVSFLSVCDTDTQMLHSSSNCLSHTMRFLDTRTITFKIQQKSPKQLRVMSHTLRQGGGSIFTGVKWCELAVTGGINYDQLVSSAARCGDTSSSQLFLISERCQCQDQGVQRASEVLKMHILHWASTLGLVPLFLPSPFPLTTSHSYLLWT